MGVYHFKVNFCCGPQSSISKSGALSFWPTILLRRGSVPNMDSKIASVAHINGELQ